MTYELEKSDSCIVAEKPVNKSVPAEEESVEPRREKRPSAPLLVWIRTSITRRMHNRICNLPMNLSRESPAVAQAS